MGRVLDKYSVFHVQDPISACRATQDQLTDLISRHLAAVFIDHFRFNIEIGKSNGAHFAPAVLLVERKDIRPKLR
jgi:hypothetical protein